MPIERMVTPSLYNEEMIVDTKKRGEIDPTTHNPQTKERTTKMVDGCAVRLRVFASRGRQRFRPIASIHGPNREPATHDDGVFVGCRHCWTPDTLPVTILSFGASLDFPGVPIYIKGSDSPPHGSPNLQPSPRLPTPHALNTQTKKIQNTHHVEIKPLFGKFQ